MKKFPLSKVVAKNGKILYYSVKLLKTSLSASETSRDWQGPPLEARTR